MVKEAFGNLSLSRGGMNLVFWIAAWKSCQPECGLLSRTAVSENPRVVCYLGDVGVGRFNFGKCCMEEGEHTRIKY